MPLLQWREVSDILLTADRGATLAHALEHSDEPAELVDFWESQPNYLEPFAFVDGGPAFSSYECETLPVQRSARRHSFKLKLSRISGRRAESHERARLFCDLVHSKFGSGPHRILVVGGASIGHGFSVVLDSPDFHVVSFDIYPSPNTTFVADGHRVPLTDGAFVGVWVQAVLEHVHSPYNVVQEIERLLVPGGILFAETPFLQPVHEGPFDFTRFTGSGHRLLFQRFSTYRTGVSGGPASAAALALRGLAGAMFRSRKVFRLLSPVSLLASWIDQSIPTSWRTDFATAFFFIGEKILPDEFDIQTVYDGAQ